MYFCKKQNSLKKTTFLVIKTNRKLVAKKSQLQYTRPSPLKKNTKCKWQPLYYEYYFFAFTSFRLTLLCSSFFQCFNIKYFLFHRFMHFYSYRHEKQPWL